MVTETQACLFIMGCMFLAALTYGLIQKRALDALERAVCELDMLDALSVAMHSALTVEIEKHPSSYWRGEAQCNNLAGAVLKRLRGGQVVKRLGVTVESFTIEEIQVPAGED